MTLAEQLLDIDFRATAQQLDDIIAMSTKKRWSPTQLLEHIARIEAEERAQRSLERRLKRSRLGSFKPIADFDWAWPKKIDRDAIDGLLHGDFVAESRNVVLVAAQGLGRR